MQSFSAFPTSTIVDSFLAAIDSAGATLQLNVPTIVEPSVLASLPEGTLGRSLADFLAAEALEPFTTGPRRKQLHDAVHVLAGYGTDSLGEAEVQAFLLGGHFHLFQVLLSVGLLAMMHRRGLSFPLHRRQVRQRLRAAYQRGRRSRFDIDVWRPEEEWHRPLAEVRDRHGIVA